MKSIIFNTEMVKAILDGRKTQTRRLIKNNKKGGLLENRGYFYRDKFSYNATNNFDDFGKNKIVKLCSKYQAGDILYVKEKCVDEYPNGFCFRQDYELEEWNDKNLTKQWCNNINARIFLRVTNARVERLQDMNMYEETGSLNIFKHKKYYDNWNSTAKDGYKWEDNPYVFVYEFERIEK